MCPSLTENSWSYRLPLDLGIGNELIGSSQVRGGIDQKCVVCVRGECEPVRRLISLTFNWMLDL